MSISNGTKKSAFPADTVVPVDATFDFVSAGANYKITGSDLVTAFGTTGTLVSDGGASDTDVLDDQGSTKAIRKLNAGAGIALSVDANNAIEIETSNTFNTVGAKLVDDASVSPLAFRSLVAGTGMSLTETDGEILVKNLYPNGSNVVAISSLADFPTPVLGVITLADGYAYQISGSVNVGVNRFVTGTGTTIFGNSAAVDFLTSTTTGAVFTSVDNDLLFYRMTVVSTTATKLFDFTSTGATESFVIEQCALVGTTMASIAGVNIFNFRHAAAATATTGGFTFSGTCGQCKIDDCTFIASVGTALEFNGSTWDSVFLGPNIQIDVASGATGIAVAASSANINSTGRGHILGCTIFGAGTHTTGLTSSDLLWDILSNEGIGNSEFSAQAYTVGNATATTFAGTGAANITNVAFGTSITGSNLHQFTVSNAGRITYIGKEDKTFFFDATIFAEIAGGASRQYLYYIAKNGTYDAGTPSKAEYDGSNPDSGSVSGVVDLSENDYVELYVYAVTATTALTVDTCSMKIIGR